ncbi:uncharacterized protein LOC143301425 [Babylonia areolata]|uniref:uncharacterized protein LOC143301425 n=1 Tax=Babylonia areolata TaxID=304850 RepID=UPI003FD34C83
MKAGSHLLLLLAMLLLTLCDSYELRRSTSARMLKNLNDITRHLHHLTRSLGDYDEELKQAVSADSPGRRLLRRSSDNEFMSDLARKRRLLHIMQNVFDNVQRTLERQKKWATCNLNLGFTCQTEEYSNIADYYDFLNSSQSPGKKRSVAGALTEDDS